MRKTISIRVTGKVQGVFYRHGACTKARELGITGFVENLADGSVRLVATGPEERLLELVTWCRQGPAKAQVGAVDVEEQPAEDFADFRIRRF